MDIESIFSAAKLGALEVKNRVVRSATNDYAMEADGSVSPAQIDICRKLAENEVGLIFTGNFSVSPEGRNSATVNALCGDYDRDAFAELASAAKTGGCRAIVQLNHAGGRTKRSIIGGAEPKGPSAFVPFPGDPACGVLTEADIGRIAEAFGQAALRAKEAGFDGAQVHCAHGYLLSQFLDPRTNLRTDRYGGGAENRFRFVEEVFAAVRASCGPDFPVFAKINVNIEGEQGSYPEDLRYFLARFEALGAAAVELSGCDFLTFPNGARPYYQTALAELRREFSLPLILVGGVRSLGDMAAALDAGADCVAISRPFICEYDLIPRLRAGQAKAKCISCNKCFSLYKKERRRCVFHTAK